MEQKIDQMRSKVIEQVRFQLQTKFQGRTGETKMVLRPEILGAVRVRMLHEGQKVVAHFIVDNQTVKEVLQKQSAQLADSLSSHGIDIEELEVHVAGDNDSHEGGGRSFSSVADQQAMREWVGSFHRFDDGAEGNAATATQNKPEDDSEEDSDQVINILA